MSKNNDNEHNEMANGISRREWLKGAAVVTGVAASSSVLTACSLNVEFVHGVASGDPLADRVIIWTRVSPRVEMLQSIDVTWEVASDDLFTNVVASGSVTTDASKDFIVKEDVAGLSADTRYYYRFTADNCTSPVGRTKTLPTGSVERVKFAVVSCASYPHGYFHVYREIAKRDIDYVLHLGDYIYEYGPGDYDDGDAVAQQRMVDPPREIISLQDYRARYSQYRMDVGLKNLHTQHPFICVWDDHEVANDSYSEGAENHSEDEGDFYERRAMALQAYYEWMPVREPSTDPLDIYRKLQFGDLLNLYMLDTRHGARDAQLSHLDYVDNVFVEYDFEASEAAIRDESRELLGAQQMQWLQNELATSTAKWQIFGQQILMARMNVPWRLATVFAAATEIFSGSELEEILDLSQIEVDNPANALPRKIAYNLDAWDGYYAEREQLFEIIQSLDLNVINLAGDTHNAWASNLSNEEGESIGVEFATASVASPGISQFIGPIPYLNELFVGLVDDLQYANVYDRGFLMLEVTQEQAEAEWVFINSVKLPLYNVLDFVGKKLKVLPGAGNRQVTEI